MTVVRYDDKRSAELLEILLKDVEGHDIEVVGRLVENQKVRLLHQDGEQVEPALFTSAEFLYLVVEHLVREEESVEQPCVVDNVQHSVVWVE